MADAAHLTVDVSTIPDPDVRRALRQIQTDYQTQLTQQRAEIDAILEVLLEKHTTSLGELKRHVAKVQQQQQQGSRSGRLHDALWGGGAAAPAAGAAPRHV
jgi:hypothetical protein